MFSVFFLEQWGIFQGLNRVLWVQNHVVNYFWGYNITKMEGVFPKLLIKQILVFEHPPKWHQKPVSRDDCSDDEAQITVSKRVVLPGVTNGTLMLLQNLEKNMESEGIKRELMMARVFPLINLLRFERFIS